MSLIILGEGMVGGMLLRFKWVGVVGGEILFFFCNLILLVFFLLFGFLLINGVLVFMKNMVVVVLKKYVLNFDKVCLMIWIDVMRV